ncbi:MAG: HEPN domain-containing protein [Thermoleophilia bacterium]
MSSEGLRQEAERWLEQSSDDLRAAQVLLEAGHHALAAFHAQQSAEKALKGLWRSLDLDPWGHSVVKLLEGLSSSPGGLDLAELLPVAAALDKLYIPTRYPDALPGLTPAEAYTAAEADTAIRQARVLVEAVRRAVAGRRESRE